jgi:GntR family transcriptional regulator, transcriptional repressor for pyruvate dehydrogenase complex
MLIVLSSPGWAWDKWAETIPRRNLYEEVTDRIQHMILCGPLRPGDRLPTEQQLADQFGVSRTAVREAVKALVERGIVRVRQGQGTFVAIPSTDRASEFLSLFLQLTNRNITELLEARRAIELEAVTLAALRRTDDDLHQIAECLDGMRYIELSPTVDPGPFLDSDVRFHLHIAQATRNEIFVFMLTVLRDLLRQSFSKILRAPAVRLRAIAGHEQILRALQGRDPDAARAAMREHLENAQKWAEDAAAAQAEDARPGDAAPRESEST